MIRIIWRREDGGRMVQRVLFSGASQLAAQRYALRHGCREAQALDGEALAFFTPGGRRLAVIPWGPGVLALLPKPEPRFTGGALTGAGVEV